MITRTSVADTGWYHGECVALELGSLGSTAGSATD